MVVMWLLQLNVGLLLHVLRSSSLGQAPQWGEKEKRGQIGKISASEASSAVVWGGKSGQTRLVFLFPPMRSMVPGYCSS